MKFHEASGMAFPLETAVPALSGQHWPRASMTRRPAVASAPVGGDGTELLILAWILASIVIWISALVGAVALPGYAWKVAHRSKPLTLVLVALTGIFGGLYFWLRVRPEVRQAQASTPPPTPRPQMRADPWAEDAW
jgi:hypothetical protein